VRVLSTKSQQSQEEALFEEGPLTGQKPLVQGKEPVIVSRQSSILSSPIKEDPSSSEYESEDPVNQQEDVEMSQHASISATPQASSMPGLPAMVQILMDDLRTLMQGVLQTIIVEQAQQQEQQARAASTKDLKFTEPKTFSGRSEDLDDFLNDCELIFLVKADIYNQDDKKIA
jgi:hypothetical protein